MKIFLDTANIEEIRAAADTGVLDGVTTNPSLVAREGRPFAQIVAEICDIVDGPVSAEVLATDYDGMVREARALAGIHDNVVVKIPLIRDGIKAVTTLSAEDIATNVTLGFATEVLVGSVRHPKHVLEAALMGADIVTIPYKVFEAMFRHPLTDRGLRDFLADWDKARDLVSSESVTSH